MPLLDLWKSKPDEYDEKHIQQLVKIAGDGTLKDGNATSAELRTFLGAVETAQLGKYLDECLGGGFDDSGLVLQDIVNELGARLDCKVERGLYRGKIGQIGFDGIWAFPDAYNLVVEVKTTDAYAINLDTIAGYRKELIAAAKLTDRSSVLLVVGRKDTGGLEAQVRGSRHAWDMRLISADKLFQLVTIKESADEKATISKIRSILRPIELTRLDFVVDLLASTTSDIKDAVEEPIEQPGKAEKSAARKFTPVAFNNQVANIVGKQLERSLKKVTRSLYAATDASISVRALASRTHEGSESSGFWYAFHPDYQEALKEFKKSYIAFGCGSPSSIVLFPLEQFVTWLDDFNITKTEDREYWHVHLRIYKNGKVQLHRKGKKGPVDVTKFLLKS